MFGWAAGWMERLGDGLTEEICSDGWVSDGWFGGWMDGLTDGRMDGWMDERMNG
jgi:hypothetical protein